jgi:hypothetical protein
MTIGPRLPATLHPGGTDPREMLAGDAGRSHLFLAIRPRGRRIAQYDLPGPGLAEHDDVAVLRCSADAGVELLDVTDVQPERLAADRAVVVSISMRSLANRRVREHWSPLLNAERTVVLVDLRPSVHVPRWLADRSLSLRWTIFGAETPRGVLRFLTFRLHRDTGASSGLHMTPVSSLYASGFEMWLNESPSLVGRTRLMTH